MKPHPMDLLVEAQVAGINRGMTSVCSAHSSVLAQTLGHSVEGDNVVLIEATCNQVNQDGGYTGMRPADFRRLVEGLTQASGIDPARILLGGDHLGPNPWRDMPAGAAMDRASRMVHEYVAAGYSKIHIDTSMKCADDSTDGPLPQSVIAQRAAQMASVAENSAQNSDGPVMPRYVIGTEVPVPGGAHLGDGGIHVTNPEDVAETVAMTRAAFLDERLMAAWDRVRAVVAQPGVEFSDTELHEYDHDSAVDLARYAESQSAFVFEAHSTDYQTASSLRQLVDDHFAVLKVGPALTFAYREGIFALSHIEDVLLGDSASHVRKVLDQAMLANPGYWQSFYPTDPDRQRIARQFSRSDRSRYYWSEPTVSQAVTQLLSNLRDMPLPQELVSQYLPVQHKRIRAGTLLPDPELMAQDKVREVLDDYLTATCET
ncbi:MAG: class II D-tagatose-bisphosphate aldolase, non-catalytic subunit [Candidatus Nanopelagicales bacterium]